MLKKKLQSNAPLKFIILFLVLFPLFYYFNIFYFSLVSAGKNYTAFLADHLNYIQGLRYILLHSSAQILKWMGYVALTNNYDLLVVGRGDIQLVYSCLGLGVISFFAAFVLAYPSKWNEKLFFLIPGIIMIELLNIIRFILLALYWTRHASKVIDHHTIFNIIIYVIVAVSLYFWVKYVDKKHNKLASN